MTRHLLLALPLLGAGCSDKGTCDSLVQYYEDRDNDGYGNIDELQASCEAIEGYVENADDCDDRDADVFPGAPEICGDGEVNDCAGTAESAAASCAVAGESLADAAALTTITGDAGSGLGSAVANAGDIDRDDIDDQILGAPGDDASGTDAGAALVYYGGQDGALDSSDAAGILAGEAAGDAAGTAVGSPGDVNGDGDSDLLVGAPGAQGGSGRVYLILQDMESELPLGESDVILTGESADQGAGAMVRGIGDFNGDDELDFVIGAPEADDGAGRVWLITSAEESGSLADYDRQLLGVGAGDAAGTSALGGDLDGDGDTDLLVGAPYAAQSGEASESDPRNGGIFGVLDTFIEPTSLSDADTRLFGDVDEDMLGLAMTSLRDINGDGYEDFGIGAPGQGFSGPEIGSLYILPGPLGTHSFAVIGGLAIARLDGEEQDVMLGTAMAGPGDVDGDGLDDLAVAAVLDSTTAESSGAVYSLFGPLSGAVGVSADEGTPVDSLAAIQYLGTEGGALFGTAVDGGGDQDGNATAELLVGAPGQGSGSGAVYLLRASGY